MATSNTPSRWPVVRFWITATAMGLILRALVLPLSPRYGYNADHDDFARWGIQATDKGLTTLYQHPPDRHDRQYWHDGQWHIGQREYDRLCNYPPLSTYLFWASGGVFKCLSEDRLLNTLTARVIFQSWSLLTDFLMAWGCASLVARFRPGKAVRWTYLLVLLTPPFWLDSAVWGQMDSVVLAPAIWMVRFIVDRRWTLAGFCFGLTAAFKPQAVLFLPLWALVIICSRPFYKPLISLAVAAVVLFVTALPFTLTSGLAWWRASYIENLLTAYSSTTLMAMNIWYLDLLITDSLSVNARWSGISKDAWGKVFLLLGLTLSYALILWRWRRDPRGCVLFTGLSLLAFVMLPTRVHERYLVLALPWLIVAAMIWVRFWPGVVFLIAVAAFQVTWPAWRWVRPGGWHIAERRITTWYQQNIAALPPEKRQRHPSQSEYLAQQRKQYDQLRSKTVHYEWMFTIVALAGTAATCVAFFRTRPPTPVTQPSAQKEKNHKTRRKRKKKSRNR